MCHFRFLGCDPGRVKGARVCRATRHILQQGAYVVCQFWTYSLRPIGECNLYRALLREYCMHSPRGSNRGSLGIATLMSTWGDIARLGTTTATALLPLIFATVICRLTVIHSVALCGRHSDRMHVAMVAQDLVCFKTGASIHTQRYTIGAW